MTLGNDWPGEGDLRAVRWIAMRHGADHIPATAGPLSAFDHHRVSRYAHAATILLHTAAHIDSTGAASVPLPETAGQVQQVVGVVMEHATVGAVTALRSLRAGPTTANGGRTKSSRRSAPANYLARPQHRDEPVRIVHLRPRSRSRRVGYLGSIRSRANTSQDRR